MARPLRLEFLGASYYVAARGDRRERLFFDDPDRRSFLDLLGKVCARYAWQSPAYCLMPDHYQLLIQTRDANLARGMRQLNGVYAQTFNRRHGLAGHVFQGRYTAIAIDPAAYLAEIARYVLLNPLRAGLVNYVGAWDWSSFGATVGHRPAPEWLSTQVLLERFGGSRLVAIPRFLAYLDEGVRRPAAVPLQSFRACLGDSRFIAGLLQHAAAPRDVSPEVPKLQRLIPSTLAAFASAHRDPKTAMRAAWATGDYSLKEIAAHFGVHYATVSRAVGRTDARRPALLPEPDR